MERQVKMHIDAKGTARVCKASSMKNWDTTGKHEAECEAWLPLSKAPSLAQPAGLPRGTGGQAAQAWPLRELKWGEGTGRRGAGPTSTAATRHRGSFQEAGRAAGSAGGTPPPPGKRGLPARHAPPTRSSREVPPASHLRGEGTPAAGDGSRTLPATPQGHCLCLAGLSFLEKAVRLFPPSPPTAGWPP